MGDYRLMRLLARGGMGEVYLAQLERGPFAKPVALKLILPTLACRPEFLELFTREASLAARLNHPNIVQVFDHGCCDGHSFLAMEFVEGGDLGKLLETTAGPLPAEAACEITVQLARALCHAHQRRDPSGQPSAVVHGDLSPSNILLSREGAVKLADFGLARLRSMAPTPGTVAGKLRYLSPEQADGAAPSAASDIYAFGLVVFEMFAGRPALPPAESEEAALALARAGVHEFPAQFSPALRRALECSLDRNPSHRFASASELARAVSEAVPPCGPEPLAAFLQRHLPTQAIAEATPERTAVAVRPLAPPPSSARRLWLLLFAVAWAAGFAWWAAYPEPKAPPRPLLSTRPAPPARLAVAISSPPTEVLPPPASDRDSAPAAPATPAAAAPAPLTLSAAPGVAVWLDHRPLRGRTIQLGRRAALFELVAADPAKPLRVRLRLIPSSSAGGSWTANAESSPWSELSLDGRPAGQTPRSNIALQPGRHRLVFRRDGGEIEFEVAIAPPTQR